MSERQLISMHHFYTFAEKGYDREMRQFYKAGKLNPVEGWGNVVEHELTVGIVLDTLCRCIGIEEEVSRNLIKEGLIHDADKRKQVKGRKDFSEADERKINTKMAQLDPNLMESTKKGYHYKILENKDKPLSLEELFFFADEISLENELVSPEKRIRAVAERNHLEPEYVELAVRAANIIQGKVYDELRSHGHAIEKPEDVPAFLKQQIEEQIAQRRTTSRNRWDLRQQVESNTQNITGTDNKTLATVCSTDGISKEGTYFITPPELALQGAVLTATPGGIKDNHIHPSREAGQPNLSEAWYVKYGKLVLTLLDDNGELVTKTLKEGDIAYIMGGYHGLVAIEESQLVVFKNSEGEIPQKSYKKPNRKNS